MNIHSEPSIIGVHSSRHGVIEDGLDEVLEGVDIASTAFLLVFLPPRLDAHDFAEAIAPRCTGTAVFGCSSAGQIGRHGYEDQTLLVLSFPKSHFRCASALLAPLSPLNIDSTAQLVRETNKAFIPTATWNRFAVVLADGLSQQEDTLVAAIEVGAEGVPVFGGSAGDGLRFEQTFVLHDGKAHSNAAVLFFVETDLPFVGVGFDHFLPTTTQTVVTDAEPSKRIVNELGGAPAAQEYARLVGNTVDTLSPAVFAENPLLVRNGTAYHVRAVQEVLPGDRLAFLSAIDDGLILTFGTGKEIIETLRAGLDIKDPGGRRPSFILGFDCILRRLEFEQKGLADEVSGVLKSHNVVGFSTYGEQHKGVHVNQTFVGVAVFPPTKTNSDD